MRNKKTIYVNLFGGPGSGKSTLCASVFVELKKMGIDCEMALEYAKDVVWEESFKKLSNQIYIFGKQHSRLFRLNGKVDVVITDSPLLLSILYDDNNDQYLKALILSEYSKLNTLNFYVGRNFTYNPNGRMQTEDQAKEVDEACLVLLNETNIDFETIPFGQEGRDLIVPKIINKIS